MVKSDTAAIILAAGGSERFGRPKPLLDWFGITFIEKIIETAAEANLSPIIVVTGAKFNEVEVKIEKLNVEIVRNNRWMEGQSSSIICGIEKYKEYNKSSFILLLCDQPQVNVNLLEEMIRQKKHKSCDIVAINVRKIITPPILFKNKCIPHLLNLRGDRGGKAILSRFRVKSILWEDEGIAIDSDTIKDYEKLIDYYKMRVVN